jgi:tetratricopeptide (TPR) repeat protein
LAIVVPVVWAQSPASSDTDPDRLYTNRRDERSARRAAEIWTQTLAGDPKNFEAAWKLSRVKYWLGGHVALEERRAQLEAGVEAGTTASRIRPDLPEGYFWMAANMGVLAESYGRRVGLRYRRPIKDALETVLRLDPSFQSGSADRALGRWYSKVPGLLGGSSSRAEQHLRASLKYDPHSTVSHFFLAEVLLKDGKRKEARAELQQVLDAPDNADWAPEDEDYKNKARDLLKTIE